MQKILEKLSPYTTLVLVGGGTGGHISPIVAIYRKLQEENAKKIFWIGGKNSEEKKEAEKNDIDFYGIPVLKLSTTRSPKTLLYPFSLVNSVFSAYKILKNAKKADENIAIFSKGGPGAYAICLAGKMLSIPVFIHESDVIPGRSNAKVAQFATHIFLGFEKTKQYFESEKCSTVGQILDPILETENPHQKIHWKTDKKHILVFCGSQGAKSIFEAIIRDCADIDAEWIIILGKLNTNMREVFTNFQNIQIFDWLEKSEQRHIFFTTHIAITRASATTLAELEMF